MLLVHLEGFSIEELLALPDEDFAKLNFHNQPLTFKVGGQTIIAQFSLTPGALQLLVSHLDPNTHPALPPIASLAARYAKRESLPLIDWRLPLLNCVNLNPKLRQVLQRRGFKIRPTPSGDAFTNRTPNTQPWPPNTDKK